MVVKRSEHVCDATNKQNMITLRESRQSQDLLVTNAHTAVAFDLVTKHFLKRKTTGNRPRQYNVLLPLISKNCLL